MEQGSHDRSNYGNNPALQRRLARCSHCQEAGLDGTSLIVAVEQLLALARHIRDTEVTPTVNLTAVDYLGFAGRSAADRFEVVYHLYSTKKGGGHKVLKVRLPEDSPICRRWWRCTRALTSRSARRMTCMASASLVTRTCAVSCSGRAFTAIPCVRTGKSPTTRPGQAFKSRHPEGNYTWAEDRNPWLER